MRWPTLKVPFPYYEMDDKNKVKRNKRNKKQTSYSNDRTHTNEVNIYGDLNTNTNEENILHDDDEYFDNNIDINNKMNNKNDNELDYDPFQDAKDILDIMGMKTLIPNNPYANYGDDIKNSRRYSDDNKFDTDRDNSNNNNNDNSFENTKSNNKNTNTVGMEVRLFLIIIII